MTTAVWWIRRDLRLHDNHALTAALTAAETIIPLFILDPAIWQAEFFSEKRAAFLLGGLQQLDEALQNLGSRLILREGRPEDILPALLSETGASHIFAEADVTPYAQQRDARIQQNLPLTLSGWASIRPPTAVLKDDGDPYVVYTPYRRKWQAAEPLHQAQLQPAPDHIPPPSTLSNLTSLPIFSNHDLLESVPFPPGEAEARRRLEAFLAGPIYRYGQDRNPMALDGTARLSPYLRFGMLSAREAALKAQSHYHQAKNQSDRDHAAEWLSELIWRDFYMSIIYHFPHVRRGNFRAKYDFINWNTDQSQFEAWCQGRTGYPVVDAAMRQLLHTGWMHNRARMIVASFLVKDLLINWQWGERWFMQQLVDGDPAANNGGWQWAAGTGTDAAPYFRIFNPTTQGQKYDPAGEYIRRWVPELAAVPQKYIHQPEKMPPSVQLKSRCQLGQDYPRPIVNHTEARKRTLAAYKAATAQAETHSVL